MMEFLEISEKSKHFSTFSDFSIFQAIDPPKPLINDKEYWCFCKPVEFTEIMISIKKAKISEKITFFHFDNSVTKSFFAKMGPGAPKTPKMDGIALVLKGLAHPGRAGPKSAKSCANRA